MICIGMYNGMTIIVWWRKNSRHCTTLITLISGIENHQGNRHYQNWMSILDTEMKRNSEKETNKFPTFLCSTSTRQLELLLLRTRPNSWTMYINENKKNKQGAAILSYSLHHNVVFFFWFNEAIWSKHRQKDVGPCSPEQ